MNRLEFVRQLKELAQVAQGEEKGDTKLLLEGVAEGENTSFRVGGLKLPDGNVSMYFADTNPKHHDMQVASTVLGAVLEHRDGEEISGFPVGVAQSFHPLGTTAMNALIGTGDVPYHPRRGLAEGQQYGMDHWNDPKNPQHAVVRIDWSDEAHPMIGVEGRPQLPIRMTPDA